jgi:hypothetical protein
MFSYLFECKSDPAGLLFFSFSRLISLLVYGDIFCFIMFYVKHIFLIIKLPPETGPEIEHSTFKSYVCVGDYFHIDSFKIWLLL